MSVRTGVLTVGFKLLLAAAIPAFGQEDHQLLALEQAHGLFQAATNASMFADAARQYEYLANEEGIRNGHLYYNIGNSWFLADDLGRAILNYRRAERFLPRDKDVQYNLNVALALRADLIPTKEPWPFAGKLLGWHLNTVAWQRFLVFAVCWMVFWGAWIFAIRTGRRQARVIMAVTGLLSILLLASLVAEALLEHHKKAGVITAAEAFARKGNGENYAPAFQEPLHAGAEFNRLEARGRWWHVRLADGRTCWIPSNTAEIIAN
jgi:hypothetical protein